MCGDSSSITTSSSGFSVRPVHIALEGLRQLQLACKHEALMNDLDVSGAWNVMALDQQPNLIEGMATFARLSNFLTCHKLSYRIDLSLTCHNLSFFNFLNI